MTRRRGCWRLILDPPADGAWNMAVDEAMLNSLAGSRRHHPVPTLRLYGWRPAALSLGKSQCSVDPRPIREVGVDWVRRPTGGWAVLHECERTYAVVGSLRDAAFGGGVLETYRRISEVLVRALASMGAEVRSVTPEGRRSAPSPRAPEACFTVNSAHEILIDGLKLVGSAQLRRRRGFLQHGSIPLRRDPGRLDRLLGRSTDATRFVDLERALGRMPSESELDGALCDAFARGFGVELVRGELSREERLFATRLRAWKHLSLAWVRDAQDPLGRAGARVNGAS